MTAYETGKHYKVPCVLAHYLGIAGWWPVLGPLHDDVGPLNFPPLHFHIDVRFLNETLFQVMQGVTPAGRSPQYLARSMPVMLDAVTGKPFANREAAPRPVLQRRRCARQWDTSPEVESHASWIPVLEREFADSALKRMICPHRGADLSTLPVDKLGCVECPLHGLRWHVATGKLVKRAEWSKAMACAGEAA